MDIFEVLDDIEYDYKRFVPKRVRQVLKPFLLIIGFAIATVVIVIAGIPAYIWLRWTDR